MNEDAARDVLLVRALETGADAQRLIGEADRLHAGRSAAELTRWQASSDGTPASAEAFLARRAGLLLEKLRATQPALPRAGRALAWRPAIGVIVALAALLTGFGAEQVADRQRVNILAFPLLAIVAWNLVVYLLLAGRALGGFGGRLARGAPGPGAGDDGRGDALAAGALRRGVLALGQRRLGEGGGALAGAFERFGADWSRTVAPLAVARAARLLHLAAALLALGAVAGLYLRGLVFDYRIGWESTFLGAPAVHALLATVLGPAAALLGVAFPSVEQIAAIRFPASAGGAPAATWIHLHALTVALAVILPRALLFGIAAVRERRLARRLPVDLDAPYFRRLLAPFLRGAVRLRVVPYSYTVDEGAQQGLRALAQRLLGDGAGLSLAPNVGYGDEARAAAGLVAGDAQVPLTLALFSLAATPEAENHGAFLETLRGALATGRAAAGAAPPVRRAPPGPAARPVALAILVDEAPYRRRLGTDAGTGAAARLAERRLAWQAFGRSRGLAVACVDLDAPDLEGVEQRLEPALAAGGAP